MPDLNETFGAVSSPPAVPEELFKAASAGDCATVEAILAQGFDLETRDGQGRTVLSHAACGEGGVPHLALAAFLMARGADVNSADDHGNSVLMQAAMAGDTTLIARLLDAGADINHCGKDGTALMAAAWICNEKAIVLLIEKGADINLENEDGETAKCYAAAMGNPGVVTLITKTAEKRDARLEAERVENERIRMLAEIADGFTDGLAAPVRVAKPLKIAVAGHG